MSKLTKDLKVTVQDRARRDPKFRQALLQEAIRCLKSGELETGTAALQDYLKSKAEVRRKA